MSENAPPDAGGFYLVNHTANLFLIDANGRFQSTIAYGEAADTAIGKIKRLMARS
jgi:protein SCO1/2